MAAAVEPASVGAPRAGPTLAVLRRYGAALAVTAAAAAPAIVFFGAFERDPFVLFFAAVAISAWYGGLGPGLLATALGGAVTAFVFFPPAYTLSAPSLADAVRLTNFVLLCALSAVLFNSLRASRQRAIQLASSCAQAPARAEAAQQQLAQTLDRFTDAFFALDTTWRITYLNAPARRIVEAVMPDLASDLPGAVIWEAVPALAAGDFRDACERALATQEPQVYEDYSPPLGSWLAIHLYPDHQGLSGFIRDVSDRRRGADRANRLQAVAEALAEALTPDGVAEVVLEQGLAAVEADAGVVALTSDSGDALLLLRAAGYPAAEVEHYGRMGMDEPLPLTDAVRANQPHWLGTRAALADRYPNLPAAQGSSTYAAWAALPLAVEGEVIGVLGLSRSQERAFAAEEQTFLLVLARLCAQAIRRARLYTAEQQARAQAEAAVRGRDEFLSVAAHELKTPVTSLRGFAQLLERQLDRDGAVKADTVRRGLRTFDQQTRRLSDLTAQLLDVSRIQAGQLALQLEHTDLAALAHEVAQAAQLRTARHPVTVHAGGPLWADVDPLRLEQVLTNLLDNAVKYSPHGGAIELGVAADGARVLLEVRDHGLGVAPEHRARIFEPYYQAHSQAFLGSRVGLGLGLFLAREIVAQHGGTIEAHFPDDGGTAFVVALPRGQSAEANSAQRGEGQ